MKLGNTLIDDTFAEGFRTRFARLIVTAHDDHWLRAAVTEATGYATSVIACDAEAAVERWLPPAQTPDGRPGAAIMAFGFSVDAVSKAVPNRVGQCIMTCPTTAVFDGLPEAGDRIPLGKHIRYFGDGFQKSKIIAGRRYWRIPTMDGEFLVEETVGVQKGVGGGNIILQAETIDAALSAARRAVEALEHMPGVILPFPGGVVRSGSKVGSIYKKLVASTSDGFCPTLRGRTESKLYPGVNHALEIVIDGEDETVVGQAMAVAMRAAAGEGVVAISAGNYGGKLGKFHFYLHELLNQSH